MGGKMKVRRYLRKVNDKWKEDIEKYNVDQTEFIDENGKFSNFAFSIFLDDLESYFEFDLDFQRMELSMGKFGKLSRDDSGLDSMPKVTF